MAGGRRPSDAGPVSGDHLDTDGLAHLLRWVQDGVVSRRQLLGFGFADHDVRREVRRRALTPVHRGVYVNHTGPLSWEQRAWAAVLVHEPAALTLWSALPPPHRSGSIHVAIDAARTVSAVEGVVAHRTTRFDERVHPNRSATQAAPRGGGRRGCRPVPATRTTPSGCFAEVCHTRRVGAPTLAAALELRRGVPHRALLLDMLDDLACGACSVLEREYLTRVERRHGLPAGRRQVRERTASGVVYRDVDYPEWGLVVELDGRAFHDSPRAGTATSTATSTPWSWATGSPCGWDGGRCSARPATPLPGSPPCSRDEAGPETPPVSRVPVIPRPVD